MLNATEWEYVGESSLRTVYVDVSSLRREGSVVTAWHKEIYLSPDTTMVGSPYEPRIVSSPPVELAERDASGGSALILLRYDCHERGLEALQITHYSGPNLNGSETFSHTFFNNWAYVEPESIGEYVLELVCDITAGELPTGEPGEVALSIGTGFLADEGGTVITSNHIIDGAGKITVRCGQKTPSEAIVVATSRTTDIAILRLKTPNKNYLSLAPAKSAGAGTPIFTVGFPVSDILGSEPKLTDGVISSMTGIGGEHTFMQISVPIQPGNSGGPIVDDQGQVLGIVAASVAIEPFLSSTGTLPQNVNWAVKSEYAAAMFDAPPPLPPTRSRQEAISRAIKATCSVTAE